MGLLTHAEVTNEGGGGIVWKVEPKRVIVPYAFQTHFRFVSRVPADT